MKGFLLVALLSAVAIPHAQAGNAKNSLRDVMDVCSEFIIRDPHPVTHLDYLHDCFVYDQDARTDR
jgi:hypothetical protein